MLLSLGLLTGAFSSLVEMTKLKKVKEQLESPRESLSLSFLSSAPPFSHANLPHQPQKKVPL